ncbi:MAG: CAP domain-containing protein [Bacteroidetes bacterium]|nr:CAP domain-containing protein [Bacteroidota bacterium]
MRPFIFVCWILLNTFSGVAQISTPDTTIVRQEKLERLVFQYINEYRISQGKKSVKWDDNIYRVAAHHARYLSYRGIELSHFENQDRPNHVEVRYLSDRIEYFNIPSLESIENITSAYIYEFETQKDYEKVAHEIVNSWINSIAHKNAMIQYNLKVGAVAIFLEEGHYMCPVLVLSEYR